jgi:uncharacterized protein with HEPN domain
MLDMARKAVDKIRGLSRQKYDEDENLRLALMHLVQVTGEASRHVSRAYTDEHPDIPWADIRRHASQGRARLPRVDEDIVWQVVTEDLPKLVASLARLVPPQVE